MERIKCERAVCDRCVVSVCVRMFLERREVQVTDFTLEFQQLTLADEKTDFLENFLQTLATDMERDPFWSGMHLSVTFNDFFSVIYFILSVSFMTETLFFRC